MRLAALDAARVRKGAAPLLAAVVIEDMDLRVRPAPEADSALSAAQRAELRALEQPDGRRFASWEACATLLTGWYGGDRARVEGWKGSRVRPSPDGVGWWSDVNPAAQRLARRTVLATADGAEAWVELAGGAGAPPPFPVHVWVADAPGSVCRWAGPGGVDEMAAQQPAARVRNPVGTRDPGPLSGAQQIDGVSVGVHHPGSGSGS
jgi:hypothetical protein